MYCEVRHSNLRDAHTECLAFCSILTSNRHYCPLQLSYAEFSHGSELRTLYVMCDSNVGIWCSLNLVVKGLITFLLLPAATYWHTIQTELRQKPAVYKEQSLLAVQWTLQIDIPQTREPCLSSNSVQCAMCCNPTAEPEGRGFDICPAYQLN